MMASRLFAGLLLTALGAAFLSPAAWGQGFNQVFTQDGSDVWAVGDAGAIFRSLDGGATWGSYPMGTADHRGVAAAGGRVWIVDADGTLWTSVNTGYSFTTQAPAGSTPLYALSFVDDAAGWIAGAGGTVLVTVDGGGSWTPQSSGTTADLTAVRFNDALEGWGCGAGGTVIHTTDGGATWTAATPFSVSRGLTDIDYAGSTVYVTGTHGFFAISSNGGASWAEQDLRLWSRSDVDGLALTPSGAFWLCGGGGFLRRSTDGGATYFYPQHPIVTGMTDVFFYDALRGWACAGRSKNVARTTDGGATWSVPGGGAFTYTWTQKLSNGSASIRGNTLVIDPLRRETLYCVQGRTVFKSWNLGDTWTSVATISGTGTRTNAFLVSATDTLKWLAIVQDGDRVTRTTDGGATWTTTLSIAFTEYGLPLEQDANAPEVVYYGPEDGKVYKSTDFGATWSVLSNPGFRSPDDITTVRDNPSVMYVSDGVTGSGSGQVWRSTNAGLNWTLKKTVTGSEIPTIQGSWLDPMIAYATDWSSGGVQRTTDMGENWPNVASTSSAWGVDVAKDDPYLAMFAVYSGGKTYLTTNNGATFLQATISGSNYACLTYDRGLHLCHQSSGVYKATIAQPDMPADNSQSVVLVAPNGGEAWQFGEARSITWTGQNLATVKLEYRTAPGGVWQMITGSTPGPAGTYGWLIPNDPSAQAAVRVADANDGVPLDESDAVFSILVPLISTVQPAIDFGSVMVGSSKTDTLRIVNDGTGTLVISNVALSNGGPVAISRTSFSIPAGSSDTLALTYEPIAEGTLADTLRIESNAPTATTQVPLDGTATPATGIFASSGETPTRFELRNSAPNPFGPEGTVIAYALTEESHVSLVVYNALGQVVMTLVDERQPAGRYAIRFPNAALSFSRAMASTLPSGVYFYRLKAGQNVATKQMVYVR